MNFDILTTDEHSQCDFSALLKFDAWENAHQAVRLIVSKPYLTDGDSGAYRVGTYVMLNVYSERVYLDLIQEFRDAAPAVHPEPAGGLQDTPDTIKDTIASMDPDGRFQPYEKVPSCSSEEIFDILESDIETQHDFDEQHEALDGLADEYLAANFPEAVFTGTSIKIEEDRKILKIAFSYGVPGFEIRFKLWNSGLKTVWLGLDDSSRKVTEHWKLKTLADELIGETVGKTTKEPAPEPANEPSADARIAALEKDDASLKDAVTKLLKK
jgi:hypothetical protein